jgi:hypothetical protein
MHASLLAANSFQTHTIYCVIINVDKHLAHFMDAPNKENRYTQCRAFELNGQTIYGDHVVKLAWQQGSVMANDPRFKIVATSPTFPMAQGANQLKISEYKQNLPKLSRGLALNNLGQLFGKFGTKTQSLGHAVTTPCLLPKLF